jgi:hypothetical protein
MLFFISRTRVMSSVKVVFFRLPFFAQLALQGDDSQLSKVIMCALWFFDLIYAVPAPYTGKMSV